MSMTELGIEHRHLPETLVASTHIVLKQRADLPALLDELMCTLPEEVIGGPPFALFQFVTSITDGSDVEVGFPVTRAVETERLKNRLLPPLEVLSLIHRGPLDTVRESYRMLYGAARQHGMISDEFGREIYRNWSDPQAPVIELQFLVHNWTELLADNLERVLGEEVAGVVSQGSPQLTVDSSLDERFRWAKGAVERLEGLANAEQCYDVLSGCAHVFPRSQVAKLRAVYAEARSRTDDAMSAVDAVLQFMIQDPGWAEASRREGRTIYAWKEPAYAEAYAQATTDLERRQAACFCPIVRERLTEGMPLTFCYCGSGWYRQQWEGATGKPVHIEIVSSLLRGDDRCEFAIHLADDL